MDRTNTTLATASTTLPTGNMFSRFPPELVHYLFDTVLTCPMDQVALGRTCKSLYVIIQSTPAWQVLSNPTSKLARFARPVFGHPLALLAPLDHGDDTSVVCLPFTMINGSQCSWALCGNADQETVHARPLRVVRSLGSTSTKDQQGDDEQAGPILPLFLTQKHFDSAFPLLHDQARQVLISTFLPNALCQSGISSVPRAMITQLFPRLVHNIATKLVMADAAPTAHDVEVFVQVYLLWRATICRFEQEAHQWIAAEIQQRLHVLAQGGQDAQSAPLMELVALLHVCVGSSHPETKQWTWPRIAQRIVQENTIRLFQHVYGSGGCECWIYGDSDSYHPASKDEILVQVGNEVTVLKQNCHGFVHWPVISFHLALLRTLQSIPTLDDPGTYAGAFRCNQSLDPGQLAHLLQSQLMQDIRPQPPADSCATLLQRLSLPAMSVETRATWIYWCDEQAQGRSKHKQDDFDGLQCHMCEVRDRREDHSDPGITNTAECDKVPSDIQSVTFGRYLARFEGSFSDPLPTPSFTFIALGPRGSLLGHRGQEPHASLMSPFLPCAAITQSPPSGPDSGHTTLHLDRLPASVAHVAAIVTDEMPRSLMYATTCPPTRSACDFWDSHHTGPPCRDTSRLAYICTRQSDGTWYLVPAKELRREGTRERPGESAWTVAGAADIGDCIEVAREWVELCTLTCQERGVNHWM